MRDHIAQQATTASISKMTDPIASGPAIAKAAAVAGPVMISNPLGLIISVAISVALFPPKTFQATFGLLASCYFGLMYVGSMAIEYYGLSHYSADAQLSIRVACAAPMWMLWQILAVQLNRWRNSRNPVKTISDDVKRTGRK